MLFILEIAMLLGGIWAIATGKIPSFLMGGGQYTVDGIKARLLGAWLLIPLPAAFVGSIVLILLFGEEAQAYSMLFEIATIVGVAIVALVAFTVMRRPVALAGPGVPDPLAQTEKVIAKKAQGALLYALFGILGFAAFIVEPLAFIYANQALRLIDEHQVGEQHRSKARTARMLAAVVFLFYLVVVVGGVALLLIADRLSR